MPCEVSLCGVRRRSVQPGYPIQVSLAWFRGVQVLREHALLDLAIPLAECFLLLMCNQPCGWLLSTRNTSGKYASPYCIVQERLNLDIFNSSYLQSH